MTTENLAKNADELMGKKIKNRISNGENVIMVQTIK